MSGIGCPSRHARGTPLFAFSSSGFYSLHDGSRVSHTRRQWTCSSTATSLPASVAVTRDAQTGATVYLVGCVHGSRVSAEDVSSVIGRTGPDVVVLELCDARLKALRRDMARQRGEVLDDIDMPHTYYGKRRKGPVDTFRASMQRFGGPGPALLASLLTAVYKLQLLVGIDPGTEFKTAIALSERAVWQTVCGDAPATITVRNLFGSFLSPRRSVVLALSSVAGICERLIHPPANGINVLGVLLEARRLRELANIMLPLIAIVTALSAASSSGAAGLEEGFVATTGLRAAKDSVNVLSVGKSVFDTALTSYLIISALEFFRVLIEERDLVLSESIRKAASDLGAAANGGSVVAILGMMHVNGVLRYLEAEHVDFERPVSS